MKKDDRLLLFIEPAKIRLLRDLLDEVISKHRELKEYLCAVLSKNEKNI